MLSIFIPIIVILMILVIIWIMYYKKNTIIQKRINSNDMDNDELNMRTPGQDNNIVLPQNPTKGNDNELQTMGNHGEALPGNTTQ